MSMMFISITGAGVIVQRLLKYNSTMTNKKKLVVGISGASGVILGIEVLKALKDKPEWEAHLVVSKMAEETILLETGYGIGEVVGLADKAYDVNDLCAGISSGTFKTEGMAIVPCSMKTAAGIACGYSDNLLLRAADVTIKEGRKLVIAARECPLSAIHLRNLLALSELGAVIMPPMLTFYNKPQSISDMTNHVVGKVLNSFGIEHDYNRWAY
jgi:4-hydroxy-3-polyprenylbenzoate decarboxylase